MEPLSLGITTKPIRVTVVDIMGVFVPGVVWLVFLVAFSLLILVGDAFIEPSPLGVILYFVGLGRAEPPSVKIYFATIVGSLIIGYAMKPLVTTVARRITRTRKSHLDSRAAVERLGQLLQERAGIDLNEIHGGRQPFSGCKRLLRLHAPVLWEDAEHLEAEVRMLASLFVLSAISTIVSLFVLLLTWTWPPSRLALSWVIPSLLSFILLFRSFRRINDSEIRHVYTDTLLARDILVNADASMNSES